MTDHLKEAAQAWNGLAPSWAAMQGEQGDGNQRWTINPALFALAGEVAGQRMLDAACGGGHLARAFARRGARVTAVDISQEMIEVARAHADSKALGIRYLVSSITRLPELPNESFDLIVSSMALMNVPEVEKAVGEFARLLVSGGRVVFSIPHPCYPRRAGSRGVSHEDEQGEWRLDHYQVANYLEETMEVVPLPDAQGQLHEVPTFHRTLTSYVRMLVEAGFVVDGMIEPQPPDAPEAKAELGPGWWEANRHISYYLVMRARRLT